MPLLPVTTPAPADVTEKAYLTTWLSAGLGLLVAPLPSAGDSGKAHLQTWLLAGLGPLVPATPVVPLLPVGGGVSTTVWDAAMAAGLMVHWDVAVPVPGGGSATTWTGWQPAGGVFATCALIPSWCSSAFAPAIPLALLIVTVTVPLW
jgi:hypothetical protein